MKKNLLFDFDGVILDSIDIKTEAFKTIFSEYNDRYIEKLVSFHLENGGLSRFVKIKYFFENIIESEVSEEEIYRYADKFGEICRKFLIDKKYLIQDSLKFIHQNYKNYSMHIVSGAEESELKYICSSLKLDRYFIDINGSPTPKSELIESIIKKYRYRDDDTVMIGDSINDYKAAVDNGIEFYAYNNNELRKIAHCYIERFISNDSENCL